MAQVQPIAHTPAIAEHPLPLVVRGEKDVKVVTTPEGYQINSAETGDHLSYLAPFGCQQEPLDIVIVRRTKGPLLLFRTL